MKNIKYLFLLLSVLAISLGFTSDKIDCKILKNNNFTYKTGGKEVFVVFKENKHIEYHNKRKYYIKSNIDWISDCEYYLIIQESTIPNFPFDPGTKLHAKVDKIKGKKVYYTSTLGGRSWEGKMTRSKKKE